MLLILHWKVGVPLAFWASNLNRAFVDVVIASGALVIKVCISKLLEALDWLDSSGESVESVVVDCVPLLVEPVVVALPLPALPHSPFWLTIAPLFILKQ